MIHGVNFLSLSAILYLIPAVCL